MTSILDTEKSSGTGNFGIFGNKSEKVRNQNRFSFIPWYMSLIDLLNNLDAFDNTALMTFSQAMRCVGDLDASFNDRLTDFVTVITKEKRVGEFLILLVDRLKLCNVETLDGDLRAHYDRTKTLQGMFSFPSLIGVF